MRYRLMFGVGLAVGYILGSRAGRERYEQIKRMAQRVSDNPRVQEAALTIIAQIRQRAYTAFQDFRHDLTSYLEAVQSMHQTLPNLAEVRQAWLEALQWLRADYWQRYRFAPETELARRQEPEFFAEVGLHFLDPLHHETLGRNHEDPLH